MMNIFDRPNEWLRCNQYGFGPQRGARGVFFGFELPGSTPRGSVGLVVDVTSKPETPQKTELAFYRNAIV